MKLKLVTISSICWVASLLFWKCEFICAASDWDEGTDLHVALTSRPLCAWCGMNVHLASRIVRDKKINFKKINNNRNTDHNLVKLLLLLVMYLFIIKNERKMRELRCQVCYYFYSLFPK